MITSRINVLRCMYATTRSNCADHCSKCIRVVVKVPWWRGSLYRDIQRHRGVMDGMLLAVRLLNIVALSLLIYNVHSSRLILHIPRHSVALKINTVAKFTQKIMKWGIKKSRFSTNVTILC